MSDSFADLWNSLAPTKPVPQKLGTSTSQSSSAAPYKPTNDVFSLLSASNPASSQQSTRQQTPISTPIITKSASQTTTRSGSAGGGDVFSSLLSGSMAGGLGRENASMTMAERAAVAMKQRQLEEQQRKLTAQSQAAAWAGLDSLGSSSLPTSSAPLKAASASPAADDWDFAGLSVGTSKPSPKPPGTSQAPSLDDDEDDWGLNDLSSANPISATSLNGQSGGRTSNQNISQAIWDMEEFSPSSAHAGNSRPDSPGNFDFGDREDKLMQGDESDDDNILGKLSKPVDLFTARTSPQNGSSRATPSPRPRASNGSRPVSPPPHIIGQIVEMGFLPQQARIALAATDTGLDVQAALDMLLSNGAGGRESPRREPSPLQSERRRPIEQQSRGESGAPPRDAHQQRDSPRDQGRSDGQQQRDTSSPSAQPDLNAQAERIFAQASDFGMNMFSRANAFWKESKEKAQKMYEEHQIVNTRTPPPKDGRPRWMQEAQDNQSGEREGERRKPLRRAGRQSTNEYKDDDEDLSPGTPKRKQTEARQQQHQESAQPPTNVNLFSSDAPAVYVSPWRRGRPKQAAEPTTPSTSNGPPRAPSPIRLTKRQTVSALRNAIALSAKYKAAGAEKYKLGQYAEAESSYSLAIDALPANHLLLVPLLNNRALTRIKNGNSSGAVDDCTTTISIIGPSYHPAHEVKIERVEDGGGVDLGDGLVKALKRRAEAYEAREKWDLAKKDWETIAGFGWAPSNARSEAVRGVGRCRKMVTASSAIGEPPSTPAAPSRPPPRSTSAARRPPVSTSKSAPLSQALNNLRKANDAADAEDAQRHELKDQVEARLLAWKGGKETNIRALMGSLDTVLWPELGMPKVGMAELVTPAQVKIRYMKAIAKLHPDKLNARNTTVEQRMIANGVFGALNEAWNAFQ